MLSLCFFLHYNIVGVYPAADDSVTLQGETEEEEYIKKKDLFIPWNKRASFIASTYIENRDILVHPPAKAFERKKSKRFASFRRAKSTITDFSQQREHSTKKSFTLRRMNSLDRNTVKSTRSATSSLRRQNSENNTTWRKRRMSSTNSLAKQPGLDYPSINNRGIRQRRSNRYKVDGAESFFDRYQDALRMEVFSVDLNKLTIKSNKSDNTSSSTKSASPSMPLTPTSLDEKDSVFDYSEEALSKEFDYKLVGKTYQQLFYIRSRLSASARKTEFMCDGSFGCGSCELQCYPEWTNS